MRALILRRVGLIEAGAGGPVIIGRAGNGDVLRLEGFLARNGHPRQRLDVETDAEAKALVERFQIDRRLDVPNLEDFEASVHYWASPLEGKLATGQDVALVGAG